MRSSTRKSSRGFALVTVLVTIAVMAVVVGALAFKVDRWREQTVDLQRWADEQLAEHNALQVGLHALTTQPAGPGGWGERGAESAQLLRADGREYGVEGGARLAIQDGRGLVSIAVVDAPVLRQLLLGQGIQLPRAEAMLDILEDYQDLDDLKRLNGAEKSEYEALGLPPPRNDWIVALGELAAMPIWREEIQRRPGLLELLMPRRNAGLNPNTMPMPLVRALLPNAPVEVLQNFESRRRDRPFADEADLLRQTGLRVNSADTQLWVGNQSLLRVRAAGSGRAHAYNVVTTPRRLTGPWMILERHPARISPNDATSSPARYPFVGSANPESESIAPAAR